MEIHNTGERIVAAALANEASGQRCDSYKWLPLIARASCDNIRTRA